MVNGLESGRENVGREPRSQDWKTEMAVGAKESIRHPDDVTAAMMQGRQEAAAILTDSHASLTGQSE